MHSRSRLSAAELYVGPFRGEVKRLSANTRRVHLAVLAVVSVLALCLVYKMFCSPYWLPNDDGNMQKISLLTSTARPVDGSEYVLPHRAIPLTKIPNGESLLANFDIAGELARNSAVYIPIHSNRLQLWLNGKKLLSSQKTIENPLEMRRRSSLFLLPYDLLKSQDNELKVSLHQESDAWLEMSPIYIGSHLPLQYRYELTDFVSTAILWFCLVGSIWVIFSVSTLLYAGGNRYLLISLSLSLMAVLLSSMQLADTIWIDELAYVTFHYALACVFIVVSALNSYRHLRSNVLFRLGVSANILVSGSAITGSYFGQLDILVLAWFLVILLFFSVFLVGVYLLYKGVKQVFKEGRQSLNPFLVQVLHARFLSVVLSFVLVCSELALFSQAPIALINLIVFIAIFNSAVLALLSGLSRTQELTDYRENIRAKLRQQEQDLWDLSHEHLEAMRWTVIGQSAVTLADKIRAPLMRIAGDLMVLKLDPNFQQSKVQWQRLKRSTDRCVDHVNVIESLVQEDRVKPTSLRLDLFVTQSMLRLQESYMFSWELHSDVKGWVEADKQLLERVIESLVDNAHHSAVAAQRALALELFLDRDGEDVRLVVQDNGGGIDADIDVFQPFYSSRAFGLGIGVNLAQKHLRAMGGRLTLDPCQHGARFCVHLPIGTVL